MQYRLNILSMFRGHDRNPTILLSLFLSRLWAHRFKNTINITCLHLRGEGVNPGKWVPSALHRHLKRLPGTGTTWPMSTPESSMLLRPKSPVQRLKGTASGQRPGHRHSETRLSRLRPRPTHSSHTCLFWTQRGHRDPWPSLTLAFEKTRKHTKGI